MTPIQFAEHYKLMATIFGIAAIIFLATSVFLLVGIIEIYNRLKRMSNPND